MPSFPIVEFDPSCDCLIGLLDALKVVMPDTLLLDRPEESFDHSVLFRGIGSDELLLESVGLDGLGKGSAGENLHRLKPVASGYG